MVHGVNRPLVTFAKSQITRIILHNEECYPPCYDTLDFVPEAGKLGGIMWLRGADQLVLWVFYNE